MPTTISTMEASRTARPSRTEPGPPPSEPTTAATLFEPFVRGDRSRSRRSHDGAGLGLTITHRITEQHGGSLEVSATPGGGATLTLRLPAADTARSGRNL